MPDLLHLNLHREFFAAIAAGRKRIDPWNAPDQWRLQGGGHPSAPAAAIIRGEFATLEWIDWFNNRRLLEPIGYIPPAEPRNAIAPCWSNPPWPRDSNKMASGNPGAVHMAYARPN
jgi:hypothetical protein